MYRAHIYLLQVVKLLFHYINYPPDIQFCRNTKIAIKFPNITVTFSLQKDFKLILHGGDMLKSWFYTNFIRNLKL